MSMDKVEAAAVAENRFAETAIVVVASRQSTERVERAADIRQERFDRTKVTAMAADNYRA